LSRRNISNKLSVEFTPGRIIRWRKRRFVVVDCTGFEAIIAREVGKRRLERIPVAEAQPDHSINQRAISVTNLVAVPEDKWQRFLNALRYLANELRISIVCLGTEEMMRVIRSVSSVENRFPPVVLPQWHIDNEFRKLLASFEKIIPLKYPSDLQDSTTLTAKFLTRSEGTIGELKTLLAAAATEAMRSGTERLTEEIIDGCNYVPPSTRKQRLARG